MVAWQQDDDRAFDLLVRRYNGQLFGFLLRLTHGREQAEDAYSDTLFRLVRSRHLWQPGTSFRTWIFTIARNCAADQRRGRRRWLNLVRSVGESVMGRRTAPPLGEQQVMRDQLAARLDEALEALPEEHRAVVLLTYKQDMDGLEVAAVMGLTHRQVRDRLAYARKRLGELLGEGETET